MYERETHIKMAKLAILFLSVALFGGPYWANAQSSNTPKDTFRDTVYLKNGDRLTGTIKELDRGKLRIKTITMDTVYVNWVDVASVDSSTYLRIARTDGSFSYGRVQKSDLESNLRVVNRGESICL